MERSNIKDSVQKGWPAGYEGKRVYLASPMFNKMEKDYNIKLAGILEEYGYTVFVPQCEGLEAALLKDITEDELVKIIFALDKAKVEESDIIFMNLDGRVPDEGACVELGMGYALGKRCYGIMTDTRTVESGMTLNPMITGCMIKVFMDYDGDVAVAELRDYLSKNSL